MTRRQLFAATPSSPPKGRRARTTSRGRGDAITPGRPLSPPVCRCRDVLQDLLREHAGAATVGCASRAARDALSVLEAERHVAVRSGLAGGALPAELAERLAVVQDDALALGVAGARDRRAAGAGVVVDGAAQGIGSRLACVALRRLPARPGAAPPRCLGWHVLPFLMQVAAAPSPRTTPRREAAPPAIRCVHRSNRVPSICSPLSDGDDGRPCHGAIDEAVHSAPSPRPAHAPNQRHVRNTRFRRGRDRAGRLQDRVVWGRRSCGLSDRRSAALVGPSVPFGPNGAARARLAMPWRQPGAAAGGSSPGTSRRRTRRPRTPRSP